MTPRSRGQKQNTKQTKWTLEHKVPSVPIFASISPHVCSRTKMKPNNILQLMESTDACLCQMCCFILFSVKMRGFLFTGSAAEGDLYAFLQLQSDHRERRDKTSSSNIINGPY